MGASGEASRSRLTVGMILVGALCLLIGGARVGAAVSAAVQARTLDMIAIAALFTAANLIYVAVGVGILLRRAWARYLAYGLLATTIVLELVTGLLNGFTLGNGTRIAVPLLIVALLNLPSWKAAFDPPAVERMPEAG